jgi:hypothetical protein
MYVPLNTITGFLLPCAHRPCDGKGVPEWFRSALRAPLHPSHCLPRPLRERAASGPLPLMCPRVDTPSGAPLPSAQSGARD